MKTSISTFFKSLTLSAALVSTLVYSSPEDAIKTAVQNAIPQFAIETINKHEGSGLYIVKLVAGPTLHMSADGKYFVAGDLYRIDGTVLTNESEVEKLAQIETLPLDEMIIYSAQDDEKAHITVFTDVDCGYCRMLHKEVPRLNEMGVTVRYLAYPRAGIGSEAYNKMVSVWCSDDPKAWLTKVKLGQSVPENKCTNPVASQFRLGNSVGVKGTPSIILDSGRFIPGYLSADELLKELGL